MKDKVYHSSYTSGITELTPRPGSHGVPYVYAAKDKVVSVAFMTNKKNSCGDLSYWKGRNQETGKMAIVERYPGAFNDLYNGVSGSIYVLPGDTFQEDKTQWDEEVVSAEAVPILEEIKIDNIWEYLKELEKEGALEIYIYPNRHKSMSQNDDDLVQRILTRNWTNTFAKLQMVNPEFHEKLQNAANQYQIISGIQKEKK